MYLGQSGAQNEAKVQKLDFYHSGVESRTGRRWDLFVVEKSQRPLSLGPTPPDSNSKLADGGLLLLSGLLDSLPVASESVAWFSPLSEGLVAIFCPGRSQIRSGSVRPLLPRGPPCWDDLLPALPSSLSVKKITVGTVVIPPTEPPSICSRSLDIVATESCDDEVVVSTWFPRNAVAKLIPRNAVCVSA